MPQRPPNSASKNAAQPGQPGDVTAILPTEERRSLAPDLLLDTGLTWEKYKLPVMAVVTLLVLAFAGWSIYQSQAAKSAAEAGALLDGAKTAADYQKVIDTYPGSPAAANAYLLLGRAKFDAKDYVGAAQAWRDYAAKFPSQALVPDALVGEAGALEAQGKPDEARALYQRAATSYQASYIAPLARISEATLLLSQHKIDEAKHVYEDVIASSPKSDAGQMAEQGLKTLYALPPVDASPAAHVSTVPTISPAPVLPAAATPTADGSPTPAASPAIAPSTAASPSVAVPDVSPAATPATPAAIPTATP